MSYGGMHKLLNVAFVGAVLTALWYSKDQGRAADVALFMGFAVVSRIMLVELYLTERDGR